MSLSRVEKERILRAVETDREFRYALMGLLGFKELIDRFSKLEERQLKLEERQQKLEERQQQLEERFARLEERFAKLEERQQKLEERFARLEERFAALEEKFARLEERQQRLEERFARLEERQQRLEERQLKLEERQQKLEEEMSETRRVLTVIAHRFGVLSEESFRQAMKFVVEKAFRTAKVERWVYKDEEGVVYGYPSIVEADVVVRDGEHILVEVKSRVSKGDIGELYRIGRLYERVKGVKPKLVIAGGFIDPEARRIAEEIGVKIIPAIKQESLTT